MNDEQFEKLVSLVLDLHNAAATAGMSLINGSTEKEIDVAYFNAGNARLDIYDFVDELMKGN